MSRIVLPQFGLTMTEGAIARWFFRPGDTVRKGDVLFEVETDKATMDYESPEDGVLTRVLVEAGSTIPCGAVVALLNEEELPEAAPAAPGTPSPSSAPGRGSDGAVPAAVSRARKTASPRARRLAERQGVDWQTIDGSGDGGQVTEKDVQAFVAKKVNRLSNHRRILAERLVASVRERAHIYLKLTIDMTEARRLHRSAGVAYNDLFVKALGVCLKEFPLVNAGLSGDALDFHEAVNIGLAVAVGEEHLFVPVLRDVARKSLDEIREAREALTARAREKKLTPDEMSGGTFTLSNLGMYGVEEFTAIVNPPESGILAAGAVTDEARVVEGRVEARPVMRAVLGVDHRVVDGALGAKFLGRFKALLENPEELRRT